MDDLRSLITDEQIWQDLERAESLLLEAVVSEDDYLTKIAQHLLLAGGKRFRPLLALLSARFGDADDDRRLRSEEHTSELQSRENLVCRLLLEKKNNTYLYALA